MTNRWTSWHYLTDDGLRRETSLKSSGVYQIRLVRQDASPQIIHRLGKDDPTGILYIGSATNLQRRLKQFLASQTHSGSETLLIVWPNLKEKFGEKINLQFRTKIINNGDYEDQEQKQIHKYYEEFLEVPPMNSNIPNKKKFQDEWSNRKFRLPTITGGK